MPLLAIHFMFSSSAASYPQLDPYLHFRTIGQTNVVIPVLQPYLEDAVKSSPRDVRFRPLGRDGGGSRQTEDKSRRLYTHCELATTSITLKVESTAVSAEEKQI